MLSRQLYIHAEHLNWLAFLDQKSTRISVRVVLCVQWEVSRAPIPQADKLAAVLKDIFGNMFGSNISAVLVAPDLHDLQLFRSDLVLQPQILRLHVTKTA